MSKTAPSQKITATAFIFHQNKVVLVKRAPHLDFFPDTYELPGGHIEYGEQVAEGLQREIGEECRIDVFVGEPFYVYTYCRNDIKAHVVEIGYFVTPKDIKDKIILSTEHTEFLWVEEKQLKYYLEKNNIEGYRLAKKGFEILRSNLPKEVL